MTVDTRQKIYNKLIEIAGVDDYGYDGCLAATDILNLFPDEAIIVTFVNQIRPSVEFANESFKLVEKAMEECTTGGLKK